MRWIQFEDSDRPETFFNLSMIGIIDRRDDNCLRIYFGVNYFDVVFPSEEKCSDAMERVRLGTLSYLESVTRFEE